MKKNNNLVTIIVVAVVVGALGFFGGMQYGKTATASSTTQVGQNGQGGFARGQGANGARRGGFGGATAGEIVTVDGDSVTVKLQDGSSKIINISDKTTINKATTGTKADLKTGERVTAIGTTNSDGSVTAQMLSLGTGMMRR